MKRILLTKGIFILILIIALSCTSDDDNRQICLETNVVMIINGESQNFQAVGRGIDLREDGYELLLSLYRRSNDPFREQSVTIKLPYQQTGENIMEAFLYNQFINNTAFSGDFLNGDFQNNVITNTDSCFYATFSGRLSNENQEIIITEGELRYEYEEPFEE